MRAAPLQCGTRVYQLTCPTCQSMTESPFVRSGAVVRCESCRNKYRIKTAHVERVLTTGPRTLDETEAVLRTDSVDIDPDEASPVSIDDEGNVVGLSGLSELMRQSDVRGSETRVQSQMDSAPPPAAQRLKSTPTEDPPAIERLTDEPVVSSRSHRRARRHARQRRRRTQTLLIAALGVLVVVSGIVLYTIVDRQQDKTDSAPGGQADQNDSTDKPGNTGDNPPDLFPPDSSDPPVEPQLFANIGPPEPNPDPKYVAPAVAIDPDALPADVPTVVIPAERIMLEGWYVTTPPRGAADAGGEADFTVSELQPSALDDGRTLLSASVRNNGEDALLAGELHIMLLDSSGGVFAEAFLPLSLIAPNAEQAIALPVAARHWQRQRGVRTSVKATDRTKNLFPIPDVQIDPVGAAEHTALRLSARYNGLAALRGVLILVEATDAQGNRLARFVVENEQLFVARGGWLDLVVATPMEVDETPASWSAVIQPRGN